VGAIIIKKLLELPSLDPKTRATAEDAVKWLTDEKRYANVQQSSGATAEEAKLEPGDLDLLTATDKVEKTTKCKATCKMFWVPEKLKLKSGKIISGRRRFIQHPRAVNDACLPLSDA
jgi:hypothetical protein